MHKPFAASPASFTATATSKSPSFRGSTFNVIVTNTENPHPKPNVRANAQQARLFAGTKAEETNRAGQPAPAGMASLPHRPCSRTNSPHPWPKLLGKWGEGQNRRAGVRDDGIKKVRRTIDCLAADQPRRRQRHRHRILNASPCATWVVWYGLGEGIRDGVLKELANNIQGV